MKVDKTKNMKELMINIRAFYCYSCHTSFSTSHDFATHHHHHEIKTTKRKISQQPTSKEPAETLQQQFVNCLKNESEINVTCHSCSTQFNSLHPFLAHLYTKNVINSINNCKPNNEPPQSIKSQVHCNDRSKNNNSFESIPRAPEHKLSPLSSNKIQIPQSSSHLNKKNNDNIMTTEKGKVEIKDEHDDDGGNQSDLDYFPETNDNISESEPESDVELFCTEFKCKFPCCSESFRIKSDLKTHYQTHFSIVIVDDNNKQQQEHQAETGENEQENSSKNDNSKLKKVKYACKLCSKTYCTSSNLRQHHRNVHSGLGETYKCEDCSKSFSQKAVYKRHLHIHIPPEKRAYKCTFPGCTKSFNILSFFKRHSKIHTKKKNGTRGSSDEISTSVDPTLSNLKTDQIPKIKYECDVCHKKFVNQKVLRDHQDNFHSDKPKDYLCTQCGKCFVQRSVFKRHMHSHVPPEDRPYKCSYPDCSSTFVVPSFLRIHEKTHQGISRPVVKVIHQCQEPECTASFKTAIGLRNHKQKVHEGITPLFKCRWSHCAQIFIDKPQLYHHTRTVHQEDHAREKANAPFLCEHEGCSKRYHRKIDLKYHEQTHGPATFECTKPGCVKKFKLRNALVAHIRNHNQKYDKLCSYCGRNFLSNYQLKYHIRASHLRQKDYKCTVDNCERTFVDSSHRRRHILSCHTGDQSLKCSLCPDVKFKNKQSLSRHLNNHHNHEEEEEEVEEEDGGNESEEVAEEEDQHEEIEENVLLEFDLNNES